MVIILVTVLSNSISMKLACGSSGLVCLALFKIACLHARISPQVAVRFIFGCSTLTSLGYRVSSFRAQMHSCFANVKTLDIKGKP